MERNGTGLRHERHREGAGRKAGTGFIDTAERLAQDLQFLVLQTKEFRTLIHLSVRVRHARLREHACK